MCVCVYVCVCVCVCQQSKSTSISEINFAPIHHNTARVIQECKLLNMARNDSQQKRRKSLFEFVTRLGPTSKVVNRSYLDTVEDVLMNGGNTTEKTKSYLLANKTDVASLSQRIARLKNKVK